MDKLKRCPFCGGYAVIEFVGRYECFVRCNRCKIEQPLYKSKYSAVKAWNRRREEYDR